MANLTLTNITAALAALGSAAFLASCTKQEIAPDKAKAREVPSATVAASVAPTPVATATAAAPDDKQKEKDEGGDASLARKKMGGPAGATSGQMSCGAGKCSGEVSGKKK